MTKANGKDAKPFVNKAHASVKRLGSYKFHTDLKTYKGKKVKRNSGDYFFKKTSRMRFVVTDKGFKKGSIVVKQPDGVIRAKGGGIMGAMKITLEPNSRMLRTPNGFNVIRCDFASLYAQLKGKLSGSYIGKVTSTPLTVEGKRVYVVELFPRKDTSILAERILFHPGNYTPVKWDIFRNGRLFSTFIVSGYSPNASLKDDLFKL